MSGAPSMACTAMACTSITHRLLPPHHQIGRLPVPVASPIGRKPKPVRCMTSTLAKPVDHQTIVRRSGDYIPTVWEHNYLQSLSSNYVGEAYGRRAAKLKEDVRMMLEKAEEEPLEKLELVDMLQWLGVSYHYENEIKGILESLHNTTVCSSEWCKKGDHLYATALHFRLMRQHGYMVRQEVFESFKDKSGKFEASLSEDTLGMLYLYEASYLLTGGESILEEARDFSAKHLKEIVNKEGKDSYTALLVSHALELPLHWRMPRMEARWFIPVYEKRQDMNPTLLEFAKLDYNMVQAIHQEDLKHASRWWESLGWRENLSFARDRLMESFIWSLGETFEPQFDYHRRMSTRVNVLITVIDDVFDLYGTLDELYLFTDAVDRWDVNAVENLPDYMKICFYGLFNTVNEMAYESLKGQGQDALPYLKRVWADLLKCYLKEATWYYSGKVPTLEEYLDNGWKSLGSSVLLVHGYFLRTSSINKEALDGLENYHDIIIWTSRVLRLVNDLGTSAGEIERGDTAKSIQVCMHETGKSEEDARERINHLIHEGWKKINETRVGNCPFDRTFIENAKNMARLGHFLYFYGDGHGKDVGKPEIRDCISQLLVDPVPL